MKSLIACLLLLSACADPCYWRHQEIKTGPCRSEVLHYLPINNTNGIDLEFQKGTYGTLGYVGVYCKEIPPSKENALTSEVIIAIDGAGMRYYALRMEGGQRLLLPDVATTALLDAFCAGKNVIIGLEGYYGEFLAADFEGFD
jgi:hypothetical protein